MKEYIHAILEAVTARNSVSTSRTPWGEAANLSSDKSFTDSSYKLSCIVSDHSSCSCPDSDHSGPEAKAYLRSTSSKLDGRKTSQLLYHIAEHTICSILV